MELSPESRTFIYADEQLYKITCRALVVIPEPWEEMRADDRVLLDKILRSVNLSLAQATVIHAGVIDAEQIDSWRPGAVLVFGSNTSVALEPYTPGHIANVPVLKAAALGSLDDSAKRRLWEAMKQMFAST